MKINEVTQMSDKTLFEELDKTNDTGIATADLVKIVRADQANQWTQVSVAELFDMMNKCCGTDAE